METTPVVIEGAIRGPGMQSILLDERGGGQKSNFPQLQLCLFLALSYPIKLVSHLFLLSVTQKALSGWIL
ncbi:hypothetical protein CASFOL_038161 [Castilleja foliolosa]|uniref:Uncharacterized protein n=1 Tax=Castilleja foliolosa TaxID=1961234 RepID=A0ABD3BK99_9LAMI